MKPTEAYIADYHRKHEQLAAKGETWRMRVTLEEFVQEVERIQADVARQRQAGSLPESHILRNAEACIGVMLMDVLTTEEKQAQAKQMEEAGKAYFASTVPRVREQVKALRVPLNAQDISELYRWLWREQTTLDELPPDVLEAFKRTRQYRSLLRKGQEE